MTALSPPKYPTSPAWLGSQHRSIITQAWRYLGALAVLATGVAHIEQYSVDNYSTVPTIGTLFLLNFVSATIVALALLAPVERLSRRFGPIALAAISASGAGIAGTSLVALLVSEQTTLFGFMEYNYRPEILVAIASEAAATVVLAAFTVIALRAVRAPASHTTSPRNRSLSRVRPT